METIFIETLMINGSLTKFYDGPIVPSGSTSTPTIVDGKCKVTYVYRNESGLNQLKVIYDFEIPEEVSNIEDYVASQITAE